MEVVLERLEYFIVWSNSELRKTDFLGLIKFSVDLKVDRGYLSPLNGKLTEKSGKNHAKFHCKEGKEVKNPDFFDK